MKKRQTTMKQAPPEQRSGNRAAKRPVPSGQERMVTQAERDEVEALLQRQPGAKSAEVARSEAEHEIM